MVDIDLGQLNAIVAQLPEPAAEILSQAPEMACERGKLIVLAQTATGPRRGFKQALNFSPAARLAQAARPQYDGENDDKGEVEPEEERRRSAGEENALALNQKRVEHLHATPTPTRLTDAAWSKSAPCL